MLTEKKILKIAKDHVKGIQERSGIPSIIYNSEIIIKDYGIIYGYGPDSSYKGSGIAGGAPFLVENETGKIVTFGTLYSVEAYIRDYEEERKEGL